MSSTIVKTLRDNEFLQKLVSPTHIDCNDHHYWHQLLSCSFDFGRASNARVVETSLEPYLIKLALNNRQSLNTGSLVRVFIDRMVKLKSQKDPSTNSYYLFQAYNALYLLRCICKNYIENLNEEQLVKNFISKTSMSASATPVPTEVSASSLQTNSEQEQKTDGQQTQGDQNTSTTLPDIVQDQRPQQMIMGPTTGVSKQNLISGETTLEQFLLVLIEIIVDIPLIDTVYQLHVESINVLLILMSSQMYSTLPTNKSTTYRSLMDKKNHNHAIRLTNTLLNNFIEQRALPEESGSIIIGLASGLWNVLTLGYGRTSQLEEGELPPLARQSLLLLNALTNIYSSQRNPYRDTLIGCQDSQATPSVNGHAANEPQHVGVQIGATYDPMNAQPYMAENHNSLVSVDYARLHTTICRFLNNDQVALLMYLLLYNNHSFRSYVFSDTSNMDNLLIPILKVIYTNLERGLHHGYMVIIIMLILSEEILFNEAIHEIQIRSVPWYTEKSLNDISLGSLATLVIVRAIQINTFRIKDEFLHKNLYAILANISSYFKNLHPYACQRIVELLARLTKRYSRHIKPDVMIGMLEVSSDAQDAELYAPTDGASTDNNRTESQTEGDSSQTVSPTESVSPMTGSHTISSSSDSAPETFENTFGPTQKSENVPCQPDITSPTTADQCSIQQQQQECPPQQEQEYQQPQLEQRPLEAADPASIQQQQQAESQLDARGMNSVNYSQQTNNYTEFSIVMEDSNDVSCYGEVMMMLLVVLDNCLQIQMRENSDLIYTLLYRKDLFHELSRYQSFQDLIRYILEVLDFFYERVHSQDHILSVSEVKAIIELSLRDWPQSKLKAFSNLRFRYIAHDKPEEFFVPYVWTRIFYMSGINWNPNRIVLFNQDTL